MSDPAIALFAKAPLPGNVKTRLVPPFTYEDAARIARASLRRAYEAAPATWALRRVLGGLLERLDSAG
jgi:hypothetical protein